MRSFAGFAVVVNDVDQSAGRCRKKRCFGCWQSGEGVCIWSRSDETDLDGLPLEDGLWCQGVTGPLLQGLLVRVNGASLTAQSISLSN